MKETLLLIFVFCFRVAIGQPFNHVNTSVVPVQQSSTAWGDYDNDGDLDLAISGKNYSGATSLLITYLYNNDGTGSLTLVNSTSFQGMERSLIRWADFNQDNLLDLLLVGLNTDSMQSVTLIYQNLGGGNFSQMNNTNLPPFSWAAGAACEDFDNDGDIDLFISGNASMLGTHASMFFNDGNGTFSPDGSFIGVSNTSMASGDFDNDGDIDIIYSGISFGGYVTKYYKNLGNGTFIEDTSSVFAGVNAGSIAAADFDKDGDLDIIISGWEETIDENTRLYENNGQGFFQHYTSANFIGLINCDIRWGDYDADGDMDIIMSGSRNNNTIRHTKIYTNQGSGDFTELTSSGLQKVFVGTCDWVDIDNDADLDIFITGRGNSSTDQFSLLYINGNLVSNSPPHEPTNLTTQITGDVLIMSWERATDSTTPQTSLSYNYYIRKMDNAAYQCSPTSNITNGKRMVIRSGNTSLDTSWTVKGLTPGTYMWSVQSIDNGYIGSPFAEEQSFSVVDYSELNVNIYPIPSYNYLTLNIQSPITGDMNVTIYDLMGRKVLNTTYSIIKNVEWSEEIQLPKLASGTYNVIVTVKNETVRRRVVIIGND